MGGIGAIGGGACLGGMSGVGGASACGSSVPGSEGAGCGIDGMSPQMQQLVDLMGGLTSAQILIALMMSRGKGKDEDSGDLMAQLLGMAMSNQLAQLTEGLAQLLQNGGQMESFTCGTTVGTQLNVLA